MMPSGSISDCSIVRSLNYNDLHILTWRPHPSSSSLVYLRKSAFTLIRKCAVRPLDCPHQASIELLRCMMAVNWEQNPFNYVFMAG